MSDASSEDDANARSSAIEAFTERLVQVRAEAGDPSFRAMAKRSGAISHATMHDAVQGVRLPSWETTVEFARACGVEPESLREEWEQADAIVHPPQETDADAAAGADASGAPADPEGGAEPAAAVGAAVGGPQGGDTPPGDTPDGGAGRAEAASPRRSGVVSKILIALAAVVVLGLIVALAVRQFSDKRADAAPQTTDGYPAVPAELVGTRVGDKGCPVNLTHPDGQQNPPRAAGDRGSIGDDGGFQDCSVQRRGAQLVRTFNLVNKGRIDWVGRKLVHIQTETTNPGCSVPREVVIPPIPAGKTGQVEVDVTAPDKPGVCFARFMQLDKDRQWAFPDQRPYVLSFKVE